MTHHAANLLRTLALALIDTADRIDPPPPHWADQLADLISDDLTRYISYPQYHSNN